MRARSLARYYRGMELPRPAAPLFVETLRGRVLRNGLSKPLSSDQLQLCMALAVYPQGVSRTTLCTLLFPEMEPEAAMGRLKVSVHGTRRHLGPDSIIFFQDCYRFSAGVCSSDLDQIESLLTEAGAGRDTTGSITAALTHLRHPRPPYYQDWTWFAAVEKRIAALTYEAAQVAGPAGRQSAHPVALDRLSYSAQ
ncbi:MAG: hypothetical protein ACXWNJ_13870 [Vulcanimicrobiaceae bacterium]